MVKGGRMPKKYGLVNILMDVLKIKFIDNLFKS